MALLADYTFHNTTFNNAYIRVELVSGGKSNLNVNVYVYASEQEASGGAWMDQFAFDIHGNLLYHDDVAEDKNYITQGYEFIKTNVITTTDGRLIDLRSATNI